MDTGNHSDAIYVSHSKPNIISIDEIRDQVVNSMDIKPYKSKYNIYILKDSEKMNDHAQNVLLKTIEELPEYGIIILITDNFERLLPTIRSRCVEIRTKPGREKYIRNYLVQNCEINSDRNVLL